MPTFRYTTLAFVNRILNRLDLQPVSTLGETEDAEQVLDIVQDVYASFDLAIDWFPKREIIRPSTATGTDSTVADWITNFPAIPWAMALGTGVEHVYKVYYNNRLLNWITTEDMWHRIEKSGAFLTTGDPRYWTLGLKGNEDYIVMDSFTVADENQLTQSNCTAYVTKYGVTDPSTDTSTLSLPNTVYSALFSRCMVEGHRAITGRVDIAREYERDFQRNWAHALAQYKRTKPRVVHPGRINFARRQPPSIAIDPSDITDATA